jgi:hypothetical protein
MKMSALLRKAGPVFGVLLGVYLLSFGAGFLAGKAGWVDLQKARTSRFFDFNRNAELKVPLYGDLLQKYKAWERPKLMESILKGKAVRAMFLIFFNNWVVADLTMIVRAGLLFPMVLYPYGRFMQGLALAGARSGYQVWMVWLTEFGGYFLTMAATLCVVLWTLFFRRFGFSARREALVGGLKIFLLAYAVSGVFFFIGSYVETFQMLDMSLR